jgi:hypothetical protein
MGSSQRIVRIQRVIERRIRPICIAVARIASMWEIHLHMIRVCRAVEISRMARVAIFRNRCVVIVDMALSAG